MGKLYHNQKLLDAKATIDTASGIGQSEASRASNSVHIIVFGAGVGAGAVVVESSHDPAYTGAWALLATVTFAAATKAHEVAVAGPHMALRHRISVGITGGTVDSYIMCTD